MFDDFSIDALLPQLTDWSMRIVGALVALFVAWTLAGWAKRAVGRNLEKRGIDAALSRFFANLVRYAILAGAVLGVLGLFGIQTTSFAALIAAMGLAIGLAFQGTLSNFASGVMLLVFRPFKIGDFVNAGGSMGIIQEIDLFTTEMSTLDNRRLVIPNSAVFGGTIENFTHHPTRRVDVAVGVDYGADTEVTREVLEKAVGNVTGVLADPPHQIFLAELGASSVDWQVRMWTKTEDFWDVHQDAIRAVKKGLEEAGIVIPFPQLDVHLDQPGPAAPPKKI